MDQRVNKVVSRTKALNISALAVLSILAFPAFSTALKPLPVAATALGGLSIRELIDIGDVSAADLAVISAPAQIELPAEPSDVPSIPVVPSSDLNAGISQEPKLVAHAVAGKIQIHVAKGPTGNQRRATIQIGRGDDDTVPTSGSGNDGIAAASSTTHSHDRFTEQKNPRGMTKKTSALQPAEVDSIQGQMQTLKVRVQGENLLVSPSILHVAGPGSRVALQLDSDNPAKKLTVGAGVSLFVRDNDVLEWNQESEKFTGKSSGSTEIYIVAAGRLQIIPADVGDGSIVEKNVAEGLPKLSVPDALTDLKGVIPASEKGQASLADGAVDEGAPEAGSENTSEAQGQKSTASSNDATPDTFEQRRFYRDVSPIGYLNLAVQVADERSDWVANKLYPLAGLNVRIAGTEYSGKTDAQGRVSIKDVPRGSRFYITVDDPYGRIRPTYSEVVTQRTAGETAVRIPVMRQMTFDSFAQIAGVTQQSNLTSVCGRAVARNSREPMVGVKVRTDISGEGPYYFNSFGYLDPAAAETGKDGRFCIFNLEPGPLTLSFIEGKELGASMTIPTFSGRHLDEMFELGEELAIVASTAAVAPVADQLGSDSIAANIYSPVDYVDLTPIGEQDPLTTSEVGIVRGRGVTQSYRGKTSVVAQSGVFEPAIYSFLTQDLREQNNPVVVPLLPRGFIEDMSQYAQVVQDVEMGSVMVEHGVQDALGHEALTFRLVDDSGQDVGSSWYYADYPVTKALFFNVPAGSYSLIIESGSKYWVGSTTVNVYSEHVSVVTSGKKMRQKIGERYSAQASNGLQDAAPDYTPDKSTSISE